VEVNTIFYGVVVGVFVEHLQDTYLHYKTAEEKWDTLNTEYGDSDADTELYIIVHVTSRVSETLIKEISN
jgi:hypothetical protein